MAPALVTLFVVKNRNGMSGLTVLYQLAQRVLAGSQARGTLHRMNASDQVECVDNKQMYGHKR
ncbi:hypothetical protein D083_3585 [Dickeya solani RNS 08.23.3.1.A]|nr:hypothetical protein D083_3585 [Dickeya solani RNS 08.23.3.1.A]